MSYYGEEIGTIVLDPGSNHFKCGYAGESSPSIFIQTALGINSVTSRAIVGSDLDSALNSKDVSNLKIESPIKKGKVSNWKHLEVLFRETLFKKMRISVKEHPLLITEPADVETKTREKMAEMVFESLEFDALFLAKHPVMCCFSVGRYSGLVLDISSGETRCVPISDGYSLSNEMRKRSIGGDSVDTVLRERFSKRGIRILDHKKIIENKSVREFVESRILRDIKENYCVVKSPSQDISKIEAKDYRLPDGNLIEITPQDRHIPPESLFNSNGLDNPPSIPFDGLHKMITDTLYNCDVDLRKLLISNVIVSGKSFLLKGFYKRLFFSVNSILPPALTKLKIITPSDSVRRNFEVAWIGGSILGSLGTFKQLMVSRKEYEETGVAVINDKCP